MVYKVTTVYITGNAFLWNIEGRIPVLKKSWLLPRECISKHRFANSVPCGNRLCVSSLTVFTCAANPALKTILIHLQQSLYFCPSVIPLLLIHLSLATQDSSQKMGIFYLYFMVGTFVFYNQLCLFLVLVFVSCSPVCLGKWLSTEIVH